jgi:hypothetical protein
LTQELLDWQRVAEPRSIATGIKFLNRMTNLAAYAELGNANAIPLRTASTTYLVMESVSLFMVCGKNYDRFRDGSWCIDLD